MSARAWMFLFIMVSSMVVAVWAVAYLFHKMMGG